MHGWKTRTLLKHYLERGVSKSELSRRFGVSRRTIYDWIEAGELDRDLEGGGTRYSPRPRRKHKLDPYKGIIDARLAEFPRLSAQRLFDESRAAGYASCYSRVRDYVREVRPHDPTEPAGRHAGATATARRRGGAEALPGRLRGGGAMKAAANSRRDRVRAMLADLKMPGALEAMDGILAQADSGSATATEAIEELLKAQIALRNNRRLETAMRSSRLPAVKTLAEFHSRHGSNNATTAPVRSPGHRADGPCARADHRRPSPHRARLKRRAGPFDGPPKLHDGGRTGPAGGESPQKSVSTIPIF